MDRSRPRTDQPGRWEGWVLRNVIDVYLAKRDSPGDEAYATLSLPAAPYAILDALEKIRPDGPDDVDLAVEEYHGFSYLAPYILPQPDLYGLNALAEKLSGLNEYEATAFHGLVKMEAGKQNGQLSLQRLLDLAYSTDCCHVVADVLNYSQLGRFYAENGFVPEVENLSDEAFDLLDFELIGRRMKSGEDGVFMEHSADEPGGYVVRHEDLRQAPPIPTGPPQKPDYVFRLNLRLLPAIPAPPDRKKLVEISLPTSEKQIMSALDSLGASGLDDTMCAILDGPLPGMRSEIFAGNEILLVNELAGRLRDMSGKDLGVLKAVMEEVGFDTLDGVIELAGRTDEYIFEPDIRGVEQAAEAELNAILGEKDAGLIIQHLNLYAYGKALLEQENAAITPYGRLQRRDGQPIQAMEQEPEMGGMEGIE